MISHALIGTGINSLYLSPLTVGIRLHLLHHFLFKISFKQQLHGEFLIFPLLSHTSRQLSVFRTMCTIPLLCLSFFYHNTTFLKCKDLFFIQKKQHEPTNNSNMVYCSVSEDTSDKFFTRSATTRIPSYCSCKETEDFSVSCAVFWDTSRILSTASAIN